MDKLLAGSVFWRILLAIGGWCAETARSSAIFSGIARCWSASGMRAWLQRRLSAPAATTEGSRYTRVFQSWNRRLAARHGLMDCLRGSLLYRIYRAIFACGRESRILGRLFQGGMTAFLLFFVGIYVLIDYALRDVFAIPVVSSVWDEALLLLAVVWIIRQRLDRRTPMQARTNPLDVPVLIFLSVGFLLMNLVSPYYSIQISGYRATAQYLLWFFVITRLLRDDGDFKVLYLSLVGLATLIAVHGIYQYIAAVPMPSNWVAAAETSVRTRVYSIFGSPNIMGDYMVIFVPMTAALAYTTKNRKLQALAWLCTVLMCFACLFTMSRGAWVAMAAAILLFVLLVDRRLFLVLLAGGVVLCFIPFVRTRIGFLFTDDFVAANTNGGRGGRWAIGMDYLQSGNPLTGFGLGMFGGAVAMQNQVLDGVDYFYLDNYYLKILVEMGYLGLGSFLVMLLGFAVTGCRALYRSAQRFKRKLDTLYPLCAGMFSGLCGVLVHCYFENIFEEPYMMVYFWTIAAMIVYIGFLRKGSVKHVPADASSV